MRLHGVEMPKLALWVIGFLLLLRVTLLLRANWPDSAYGVKRLGSIRRLSRRGGSERFPPSVEVVGESTRVKLDLTFAKKNQTEPFILPDVWLPAWYDRSNWTEAFYVPGTNDLELFNEKKKEFARAQDKEEEIAITNFFNGIRNGVILELGALDGHRYSVSEPFEKLFGWRSFLVEADPQVAKLLPYNRPNAVSIHAAVCNEARKLHFVRGGLTMGNLVELVENIWFLERFFSGIVKDGKLNPEEVNKLPEVMCAPLGAIFKALKIDHIDFFMLDCEGCEPEALKSLDFDYTVIDVMAIETERNEKDMTTDKVIDIVMKSGKYDVWNRQMGRNTWFVRKGFEPRSATGVVG